MTTGYPYNEERDYERFMDALLVAFGRIVASELIPAFANAKEQFDADTAPRRDAWPDDIEEAISRISMRFADRVKGGHRTIRRVGAAILENNKKFFFRSLTGVNALKTEKWLAPLIESWVNENAGLIKSVEEQYLGRVGQRAQDAVRSGTTVRDFSKELEKAYNLSKSRAKLIARDQVGKLNGQISRARSMRSGMDEYEWQTSGDERVRQSHKVLNGKICKYSDSTVYKEPGTVVWLPRSAIGGFIGIPGQDYQCRCVGVTDVEAYVNSLLEDVA